VIGQTTPSTANEENDMSISLLISFGGFRAYFGGDTEQPTEATLVQQHLTKDVDFYKASHHGSHSSSSQAFMTEMSPSLISSRTGARLRITTREESAWTLTRR